MRLVHRTTVAALHVNVDRPAPLQLSGRFLHRRLPSTRVVRSVLADLTLGSTTLGVLLPTAIPVGFAAAPGRTSAGTSGALQCAKGAVPHRAQSSESVPVPPIA